MQTAYQQQHLANSRKVFLPTRTVGYKKITEDIFKKIYTEKGATTGI